MACIPQRKYNRPSTDPLALQEATQFKVDGRYYGYPLVDLLKKQFTGLDGKDDKAFISPSPSDWRWVRLYRHNPNCGLIFCLQWLPYENQRRPVGANSPFRRIEVNELRMFARVLDKGTRIV